MKNYKEALEVYKDRAIDIQKGKRFDLRFNLPVPESHEKEYKRAIGMLEMSPEDTVVITSEDYDSFVLDEWSWKYSFMENTTRYLKGE